MCDRAPFARDRTCAVFRGRHPAAGRWYVLCSSDGRPVPIDPGEVLRAMRTRSRAREGFTLIEVLMVMLTIGTLAAMSMMLMPAMVTGAKADGGSAQVISLLSSCREQSITQRRNMQVAFIDPDRLQCLRRELVVDAAGVATESGALTLVEEAIFEQGISYQRYPAINPPDTPEGFSPGVLSREFTGAAPWWFTPEGTFVDANGDVTNGTVFVGQAQRPETARAITVFGATALMQVWMWDGANWVDQ